MDQLLVICGPTSTGKTGLGISLAKKFNGEIISADSRQVYKGMDIGTGKDLPQTALFQKNKGNLGYYVVNGVNIYGYDLVGPKEEFSISQYLKYSIKVLNDLYQKDKLPIIVGGTGFYIKGIVDGIPTADIPRNEDLRRQIETINADELFENLSQIDSFKAGSMNASDKKNPRRLVRAIEIAQYLIDHRLSIDRSIDSKDADILFIGLTAPKSFLEKRIEKRIDDRIKKGFENEVRKLITSGVDWHCQSMMSLGYRQWRDYYEGAVDKQTAINEWEKEEKKYARRQMVWWKKESRINWFDISDREYQKKVEKMVHLWHNQGSDA